jgi:drug/metabolite transporter (DMT)-like permease
MSTERLAISAAVVSSALGGIALGATRFVIGNTDPITLGAFRYGVGFVFLVPVALTLGRRWPRGKDWLGVALLGLLFFGIFPVIYNLSLAYTTAARSALALSTLPLLTMVVGAALGIEGLTARKTLGVLIAVGGVAVALAAGLTQAPEGAWRGDLVMVAGAFCMALYNVWSRPFIARSGPFEFVTAGMGVGAVCLALIAGAQGGFAAAAAFGAPQWLAILYLGIFGAALNFYLWVFALERTTPTRVANTITVNPVTASLVAALLVHEAIGLDLVIGVLAVIGGIWTASTGRPLIGTERKPHG